MTQEDLAHAAGVSVKTISRFENGHHDGRRSTVKKIADALGIEEVDVTGPPPAPLGLGASAPSSGLEMLLERLAAIEQQLVDASDREESYQQLIAQQNELLRRQSVILERIEDAIAETDGVTARAAGAADGLDAAVQHAIEGLRASAPLPPPEDEASVRRPRRRASRRDPA